VRLIRRFFAPLYDWRASTGIRSRPTLRGLLVASIWIVPHAALAEHSETSHGIKILRTGDCVIDNRAPIPCGDVVKALRGARASRKADLLMVVDGARYETIIDTRRRLIDAGFLKLAVMPTVVEGIIPSASVNKWMRLIVRCTEVNHPPPRIMVSTERFETWGDHLVALSVADYEVVSSQIHGAMVERGCAASPDDFGTNLDVCVVQLEYYAGDAFRTCYLHKTESAELISKLLATPNVTFSTRDVSMLRTVMDEVQFEGTKPLSAESESGKHQERP
jgi:hypothetical protein